MFRKSKTRTIFVGGITTVVLILLSSVLTVLAGSVTVDGTLDTGDTGSCPYEDVFEFTVSQTGTYSVPTISPATYTGDNFFIVFVSTDPGPAFSPILGKNNVGGSLDGTLNVGTTYYIHARGSAACGETVYPLDYSFTLTGPGDIICPTCNPVVVHEDDDSIPQPAFTDGRINNYDTAAPVAVYPHHVNGEIGLIIYDADGLLLLIVSPQQIADAPDNPDGNVLIAEANGLVLYRIGGEDGGLWQINAPQYNGKTYVLIFPELFHSGGYDSYEID